MTTSDFEGPHPMEEDTYNLLAEPPTSVHTAPSYQRATAQYKCHDERFRIKKRDYGGQYANLYFCRLLQMKPRLEARIQAEWPDTPMTTVLDIPEGKDVAVIGTLYKDMKLKPSILDEYTKERGVSQLVGRTKFVEPDDSLVLEDASARMAILGTVLPPADVVTGVVLALRGMANASGQFLATHVLYCGLGSQDPLPAPVPSVPHKYVALVSGLGVGNETADMSRLTLLVDHLLGLLGGDPEQATVAQVVRVVIAGGIVSNLDALSQSTSLTKARQQALALAPIKEMDMVVSQLASAVPIDVMPGPADPTNHSLPQQPLFHGLFSGASAYPSFNRVTNPHDFEVDGIRFLGTGGQNVDDVYKYSGLEDRLVVMERLLEWGHLVPTAPDTLTAYPFPDNDPFVLDTAPHVFFAGNQPELGTRVIRGPNNQQVRLISIPKFSESGTLVLLNLATLAVHPLRFETNLFTGRP